MELSFGHVILRYAAPRMVPSQHDTNWDQLSEVADDGYDLFNDTANAAGYVDSRWVPINDVLHKGLYTSDGHSYFGLIVFTHSVSSWFNDSKLMFIVSWNCRIVRK